ncbi:Oidioi.mRNA.OKI2018_I69.PAR.g9362.t1.cds [Oikopleura dioica]|uniref:Oidioi.mRNA.OKI2018_I69.PAR.g9362.t1.cds n=1 Tax=Oikopleura dioica TaxID=34765 RepID=A0ABN7RMW4_OIKDI|nr:Oidioi.mRNA.OKI2018_I69.PAR.g9362.t1.cds [Oikopleura dioica]
MNYSRFTHVADFADHLAMSFPENSIILMKGDLPSNSLRFLDIAEKRRPDCSFIDTQPMTYPWYIKMLGHHFPGINFPGKRYHLEGKPGDFSLSDFIRKNAERNIFGCIGLQELEKIEARGDIWAMPWGVCEQFFLKSNFSGENWDIEKQETYASSRLLLQTWPHLPSEKSDLPDHSWEKVANDEIYAAMVKSAMWSFDQAEEMKKAGQRRAFFTRAIEEMGVEKTPSYWFKNAALIHPTVAQLGQDNLEGTGSYEETYELFKTYLARNKELGIVTDDQEAVQKAIDDIGKFLGKT